MTRANARSPPGCRPCPIVVSNPRNRSVTDHLPGAGQPPGIAPTGPLFYTVPGTRANSLTQAAEVFTSGSSHARGRAARRVAADDTRRARRGNGTNKKGPPRSNRLRACSLPHVGMRVDREGFVSAIARCSAKKNCAVQKQWLAGRGRADESMHPPRPPKEKARTGRAFS